MAAADAPMLTWGPLLGAVTIAYYRRRRGQSPAADGRGTESSATDDEIDDGALGVTDPGRGESQVVASASTAS